MLCVLLSWSYLFMLQGQTDLGELEAGDEDSDGASSRRTHETTPEQDIVAKLKIEVRLER